MADPNAQATSLGQIIITFGSKGSAMVFYRGDVKDQEMWHSSVVAGTAYSVEYDKDDAIRFNYDKAKSRTTYELEDLTASAVTTGFEDIKAWAEEKSLKLEGVAATALWFAKKSG